MRPYQQLLRALFKNNNIIFNMTNWKVFSYPDTQLLHIARKHGGRGTHAHTRTPATEKPVF